MMQFSKADSTPTKAILADAVGLAAICVIVLVVLAVPGV